MNLSRSLLWKESAEVRPLLYLGLIIFLVFPAIGALEHIFQYHSFEIWTAPWVLILGGILSAVTAVGVIVPDFTRRFEFIRSQPIPLSQWLVTKYFAGLTVLLLVLTIPLAINVASDRSGDFSGYRLKALLAALPFTWIAIYSISFALACLIRRTALATIAGVLAMLLIYFAPLVVPGLQVLSLNDVTDKLSHVNDLSDWSNHANTLKFLPGYFLFAGLLLAISIVALLVAIIALHRDWRIESNRKTIAWTIGIGTLALPLIGSLQLGTNMPLLQTIELPSDTRPLGVIRNGDAYYLQVHEGEPGQQFLRRMSTGAEIELGPRIAIQSGGFAITPKNDIAYSISAHVTEDPNLPRDEDGRVYEYPIIAASRLNDPAAEIARLELKDVLATRFGPTTFFIENDSTMTIVWERLQLNFDISDGMHPKLVSSKKLSGECGFREIGNIMQFHYPLDLAMPVDELVAGQQRFAWYGGTITSKLIVAPVKNGIRCYTPGESGSGYLNFNPTGQWSVSPVEQLLLPRLDHFVKMQDGVAMVISGGDKAMRITLVDVTDPSQPRRIGYYASPSWLGPDIGIIGNDRFLVGEHKIYVLGRPGTK